MLDDNFGLLNLLRDKKKVFNKYGKEFIRQRAKR